MAKKTKDWTKLRGTLNRGWKRNKRATVVKLRDWLGPLEKAPTSDLYSAKSFLEHNRGRNPVKLQKEIVAELTNREQKPLLSCDISDAESCVFTLIGSINAFLHNKTSFHHPNKKEIIKQASVLLDECFECKRSIYRIKEDKRSQQEVDDALHLIDEKIANLKTRIKPIADEVSEYQSELERLASILRKF